MPVMAGGVRGVNKRNVAASCVQPSMHPVTGEVSNTAAREGLIFFRENECETVAALPLEGRDQARAFNESVRQTAMDIAECQRETVPMAIETQGQNNGGEPPECGRVPDAEHHLALDRLEEHHEGEGNERPIVYPTFWPPMGQLREIDTIGLDELINGTDGLLNPADFLTPTAVELASGPFAEEDGNFCAVAIRPLPSQSLLSARDLSVAFILRYYKALKVRPNYLPSMYAWDCSLSRCSPAPNGKVLFHRVQGLQNVTSFLNRAHVTREGPPLYKILLYNVEGQEGFAGSIVVQASGTLHYVDNSFKTFTQTVVLAPADGVPQLKPEVDANETTEANINIIPEDANHADNLSERRSIENSSGNDRSKKNRFMIVSDIVFYQTESKMFPYETGLGRACLDVIIMPSAQTGPTPPSYVLPPCVRNVQQTTENGSPNCSEEEKRCGNSSVSRAGSGQFSGGQDGEPHESVSPPSMMEKNGENFQPPENREEKQECWPNERRNQSNTGGATPTTATGNQNLHVASTQNKTSYAGVVMSGKALIKSAPATAAVGSTSTSSALSVTSGRKDGGPQAQTLSANNALFPVGDACVQSKYLPCYNGKNVPIVPGGSASRLRRTSIGVPSKSALNGPRPSSTLWISSLTTPELASDASLKALLQERMREANVQAQVVRIERIKSHGFVELDNPSAVVALAAIGILLRPKVSAEKQGRNGGTGSSLRRSLPPVRMEIAAQGNRKPLTSSYQGCPAERSARVVQDSQSRSPQSSRGEEPLKLTQQQYVTRRVAAFSNDANSNAINPSALMGPVGGDCTDGSQRQGKLVRVYYSNTPDADGWIWAGPRKRNNGSFLATLPLDSNEELPSLQKTASRIPPNSKPTATNGGASRRPPVQQQHGHQAVMGKPRSQCQEKPSGGVAMATASSSSMGYRGAPTKKMSFTPSNVRNRRL